MVKQLVFFLSFVIFITSCVIKSKETTVMFFSYMTPLSNEEWHSIYKRNQFFLDSLTKCVFEPWPYVIKSNVYRKTLDTNIHIFVYAERDTTETVLDLLNMISFNDIYMTTITPGFLLKIKDTALELKSDCGDIACHSSFEEKLQDCYKSLPISFSANDYSFGTI